MQSTTTTITPPSTAEFVNWLNAGTIISYKLGGKIEAGYEAFRAACMKEVIGKIPKGVGQNATRRPGQPSKAAQTILSILTTAPEGMTQTAITTAVGSTIKVTRVAPTLQTMTKAGLIYTKARKWFAGRAAATSEQAEEQTKIKRARGRPPKSAAAGTTPPAKPASYGFNIADGVLQAVRNGYATPAAIIAYLQQTYGEKVRANHVGVALGRHRRGGRLALTGENTWSMTTAGQETAQAS